METTETIVRALAAADPMLYDDGRWHGCSLCNARLPDESEQHDPDCPWRLAVEWVAAADRREAYKDAVLAEGPAVFLPLDRAPS